MKFKHLATGFIAVALASGVMAAPAFADNTTTQKHTHTWVAQTETIHHDAEYQEVSHPEQYHMVYFCYTCGQPNGYHNKEIFIDHVCSGSWWGRGVNVVTDHKDKVVVRDAYDEEAVTGFKCSDCGQTISKTISQQIVHKHTPVSYETSRPMPDEIGWWEVDSWDGECHSSDFKVTNFGGYKCSDCGEVLQWSSLADKFFIDSIPWETPNPTEQYPGPSKSQAA